MSTYLKAWFVVVTGLAVTAVQAVQAVQGDGFTAVTWLIIALAVLKPAAVAITGNADLGLDARAKAIVATVIALLITIATVAEPLLTDGSFSSNDLTTIVLAVLGATGVYALPNKPVLTLVPSDVDAAMADAAAVDALPAAA